MTGFLDELGKKLAERWFTLLVLPGLVYLIFVAGAVTLGHSHAFDPAVLRDATDRLAARPAASAPGTVVLGATAVLAAAAAAGLAAGALGRLAERAWSFPGHRRPARLLAERRRRRWREADARVHRMVVAAVRAQASRPAAGPAKEAPAAVGPAEEAAEGLAEAISARNDIALCLPRHPTWIGDRLYAMDRRVHDAYDLDLTGAWPRLWLVIPDTARAELTAARDAHAAAARLAGWAVLYLSVAAVWWPAVLVAMIVGATAWARARATTASLADLVEASVDLYGRDLAVQLGLPGDGPMSRETGLAITSALRKDPETAS
ncbi:hypothetical protein [Streptosporangium pseudovulgare]|uniref:Vegetative cell wall protein gp1 n=1 Tax=Streptosporangium pseudovulgare TaxID=35765 RepID=A0ABQ2QLM1_9ACTN|nr:hypothetical protein [Streptosporangium pseudovulgare]GGP87343.1 hypothetical protein GCM10010140_15820 [Streptosporangium pseudovulgare]